MSSTHLVQMRLAAPGKDEDAIQDLSREMIRVLHQETEISAEFQRETPQAGQRGDAAAVGHIVLQLASSTVVVSLVGVLKAYFDRIPTLSLEFEGRDGTKLKVSGQHLQPGQANELIAGLQKLVSQ